MSLDITAEGSRRSPCASQRKASPAKRAPPGRCRQMLPSVWPGVCTTCQPATASPCAEIRDQRGSVLAPPAARPSPLGPELLWRGCQLICQPIPARPGRERRSSPQSVWQLRYASAAIGIGMRQHDPFQVLRCSSHAAHISNDRVRLTRRPGVHREDPSLIRHPVAVCTANPVCEKKRLEGFPYRLPITLCEESDLRVRGHFRCFLSIQKRRVGPLLRQH
jgi:hypothetical protein